MRFLLRYCLTHFTVDQYITKGQYMNYDNLLIIKEMSRCVRDKYCKKPNTYQYYVGSIVGLSSYNLSDSIVESEVVTSFAFCMFMFDNRFFR